VRRAWSATVDTASRLDRRARVSRPGLLVAALFFCLSVTPSLLPRTWLVQGFISGLSATVGYASGVAVTWLGRRLTRDRLPTSSWMPAAGRPIVTALALGLVAVFLVQGSLWQRNLHTLMGAQPPGRPAYLGVLLVTILLLVAIVAVTRGLRALVRMIIRLLRRWIPRLPAQVSGVALVLLLLVGLGEGVVLDGFLGMASTTSANLNDTAGTSSAAPTSSTRSGSPPSLVGWESLGMQGRVFVTDGPTLQQLRNFGGAQAQEPIRVYVGLKSAPTIAASAELAVRELERTGAFSRAILCVVTTTGTGWVDPYLAAALEYVHNGNTALVGMQYSYLPSWISFLTERERVQEAGRVLFSHVYERWAALPPEGRPRLLVFGESLGSLGSESAFADLADVRARTDGALWVGPTNDNPLWSAMVANRDAGSTEILPIYQDGTDVRFASNPADLERPPGGHWNEPRVVYLQNPSDPVTWWSPRLLLDRPDWLTEPRGYDVLPEMRWFPVVTFLQVTADLVLAERAPPRHGHEFHRAAVAAWVAIAEPPGWSPARGEELTRLLDNAW
jgi:uncharacterized membrane protein